jgi:hypothetical protein
MKFNKVKMKSAQETPFFRVLYALGVRSTSLQRPVCGLRILLIFVISCTHAVAEDESFSGSRSVRECRKDLSVRLSVLDSFEQVELSQRSALCAFRPKKGGFPSVSAVFEPIPPGQSEQKAEQRGAEVVRSYHLVGLTDATLRAAETVTVDGRPGYRLELRYSSSGVSMAALVVQVDAQDIRYTVTGTDTTEGYQRSQDELRQVAESLMVPVPRELAPHPEKPTQSLGLGLLLFGGGVGVVLLVLLMLRRRLNL